MNVFFAVGFVVAVQQMLDAVGHPAPPRAIHQVLHGTPVLDHHAQQIAQGGRAPVASNVGFCKPNVTRLQTGRKDIPVVQADGSVGQGRVAINLGAFVWKLNGQRAMLNSLKQSQYATCSQGGRLEGQFRLIGGTGVHVPICL